jgi:phage terminase large subunit-like protein
LREKALAATAGKGPASLYGVIWKADDDAATDDPAAWRAANPLLNVTVTEDKLREDAAEAMKDPAEEANFRRLNLGIWPKIGGGRWLDLAQFDACLSTELPPADAPLWVGLDLSQQDDLCAAAYVWMTPQRCYLGCAFWLPKSTAERYEQRESIPYRQWHEAGHITLVDELTINSAVHRRIAAAVLARGKARIKAVCFDRYRATETVAALEAEGVPCVPVPQGYTLSPGCAELERRIKEKSVAIWPNEVLRWNAEHCEVDGDRRGNYWPVKPNARAKGGDGYKGKRGLKIDGVVAAVTAMTEARKFAFPAARKFFQGTVCRV